MNIEKVNAILSRIKVAVLDTKFLIQVDNDKKYGGRLYLQAKYMCKDITNGKMEMFKGRKFYLSEHMTDDEIVKTAYTAVKMAVEHEMLEGFRVDNKILFNPHVNFEELLTVSDKIVQRINVKAEDNVFKS